MDIGPDSLRDDLLLVRAAATPNTSDVTDITPWEPPYTTAWVVSFAVIILTLMVFGAVANSLTIAVIRRSSKLRTKYYTLILSLCVSDLISALLSPLFLYRRTWGFIYFALPDFFCRLYWGVDYWTSYVTAMHILSFAILRFIGVQWPTVFRRISSRHMAIWISSIWAVAFFCGLIPHAIFNEVKDIDRHSNQARWASCSLSQEWFSTWQIYIYVAYPIFLYIPAFLVLVVSLAISIRLCMHVKPGDVTTHSTESASRHMKCRRKKDRQIIIQLALIVGSFLLGYIPVTAYHWYINATIKQSNPTLNRIDWQFACIQYILLRISECLNPVFYNLASRKMRKETFKLISKMCECGRALKSPMRSSTSRASSGTSSSV